MQKAISGATATISYGSKMIDITSPHACRHAGMSKSAVLSTEYGMKRTLACAHEVLSITRNATTMSWQVESDDRAWKRGA